MASYAPKARWSIKGADLVQFYIYRSLRLRSSFGIGNLERMKVVLTAFFLGALQIVSETKGGEGIAVTVD